MAENSSIAWCHHTHNHWIGCAKVGPGCDHCYAEAWDRRFDKEHVARHWGPHAERRMTSIQTRNKPLRWQRDRRAALDAGLAPPPVNVFGGSLMDPFDNQAPEGGRESLWALVRGCPDLNWIFVTKRIGNVAGMAPAAGFGPNVIILSSIVNQPEADRDADKLVAVKRAGIAKHIGISYEPALGLVDWSPWIAKLDWLIVGGESAQGGAKGRLFNIAWAREAVYLGGIADTPVFVKQLGARCDMPRRAAAWPVTKGAAWEAADSRCGEAYGIATFRDGAGADPTAWPEDVRVREFPSFMRGF